MKFEANIFPKFEIAPEDMSNIDKVLLELPQMERFFSEAPLHSTPVATLAKVEVDVDGETIEMDSYQFVVTRRFMVGGELHVGGANGEILNVYTFISGLRRYLEERK